MDKSSTSAQVRQSSTAQDIRSLIGAANGWLESFVHLVALEGKIARIDLALMFVFGLCATMMLVAGWLMLLGSLVSVLVLGNFLGWVGALLLAALLNLVLAGVLAYFAFQRSQRLLFSATRRQLGLHTDASAAHDA